MLEDLIKERLKKLQLYQKSANPYPPKVERSFSIREVIENFDRLAGSGKKAVLTGRILGWRDQGKIIFADMKDESGTIQVVLKKGATKDFDFLRQVIDRGDFLEVKGFFFATEKGEKSIKAETIRIIAKSLRPWPSSWFGLEDVEERYRRRYLDFVLNPESKKKIEVRSKIAAELRRILQEDGFLEIETPVLQPLPGGALAAPFKTHFNALNLDVYLRIAPELYLKRLLVGGFEKIFELGKDFRNEGIDKDHYPEFTMLELYWAYQNYEGLMEATEKWLKKVVENLGLEVKMDGKLIDFQKKWPRVKFPDLIDEYSPSDKNKIKTIEIDDVFKKKIRPFIKDPLFVIDHPKVISPLSKAKEDDPDFVERFQLVVGGMEVVNGFSELNDPIDQRERMEEQEKMYREGNEEASRLDEDFLEALEYGMPPAAGLGLGLDRFAALLTNSHSIREVMSFVTLRPKKGSRT